MARRVPSRRSGRKAAAKAPPADTRFAQASHLLERGRIKQAFLLFLEVAKEGDSSAQLNVGYFYDTGQGVSRSRTLAVYWYRRAVRQGEAAAANNIGTIYRDEGRLRLAIRWFGKAANMGDGDALLEMAKLYMGPLEEPTRARRLLARVLASKRATLDSQEQAERLLRTLEQQQRLRSGRSAR